MNSRNCFQNQFAVYLFFFNAFVTSKLYLLLHREMLQQRFSSNNSTTQSICTKFISINIMFMSIQKINCFVTKKFGWINNILLAPVRLANDLFAFFNWKIYNKKKTNQTHWTNAVFCIFFFFCSWKSRRKNHLDWFLTSFCFPEVSLFPGAFRLSLK